MEKNEKTPATLERIVVKGLFGKIDYDVSLKTDGNVAIIIAPNGFGKTTLLKLIKATLSPSFKALSEINGVIFNSFTCEMSNRISVTLARGHYSYLPRCNPQLSELLEKRDNLKKQLFELNDRQTRTYSKTDNIIIHDLSKSHFKLLFEELESLSLYVDHIEREESKRSKNSFETIQKLMRHKEWNYLYSIHRTGAKEDRNAHGDIVYEGEKSYYILEEMINAGLPIEHQQLANGKPTQMASMPYRESLQSILNEIKEAIFHADNGVTVNYIPSNRLQLHYVSNNNEEGKKIQIDPLIAASGIIGSKVHDQMDEYNRMKNKATNDLPKIFAERCHEPPCGYSEFQTRWNRYIDNLSRFAAIGFLETAETSISSVTESDYNAAGTFFDVYLDVFEKTILPFATIYHPFDIFKSIFDERIGDNQISKKTIRFTPDGVRICLDGTTEIPLTSMSSGEKNDFLMFYYLVFRSVPGELFLIDEPEISLHIDWQESYVDRLLEICAERNLQAILTTHSPHIVNGHLDLLKAL